MQALRNLAAIFICAALLFQGTAYASASPARAHASAHCSEMAMGVVAPSEDSEQERSCTDMQLDCRTGMSCFAPLYAPEDPDGVLSAPAADRLYARSGFAEIVNAASGPQPPPPQH